MIKTHNEGFVSVYQDIDKADKALMEKFGVKSIPLKVVVDAEGKELGRIKQRGAEELVKEMEALLKKFGPPREQVLAYLKSYRAIDDSIIPPSVMKQIARLSADAVKTRDDAVTSLKAMGRTAYVALSTLRPKDLEVAVRVREILRSMGAIDRHVKARGLDHDVAMLVEAGATLRLREILPAAATKDPAAWWGKNGAAYRWDAKTQRYVKRP